MSSHKTRYVDGFVLIVPKDKVEEYKKMAQIGNDIWMKHGALSYRECMIEDPRPEHVELTFPDLTQAGPDDTVWFSYIEFESKEHRDKVNAAVMSDPAMQPEDPNHMENMPFEMKKMAYGGFEVLVGSDS